MQQIFEYEYRFGKNYFRFALHYEGLNAKPWLRYFKCDWPSKHLKSQKGCVILSYLSCSTNNLEDEADYFSLEQMVKRKLIKMFPASSTKEEDPGLLVVRTVPLNRAVLSVCVRLDGRFIINAEPINNQSLPFVRLSVSPVAWTMTHLTK